MKQASTTIFFTLLLITGQCQKGDFKIKAQILPMSLVILAGAADAVNQVIQFRYQPFQKAFPNLHADWWNPKISGKNKYEGGKEVNGAKFPGSTSVFVGVTDAYHCTRLLERLFITGAITMKITGNKKRWYWYLAESGMYWALNRGAFTLIYNSF